MNEKSNKLISLLGSLDRTQRRGCRKLIRSSYFAGNDDLLAFFDEIAKRLDRAKSLDKREVWGGVFGKKKPFNDVRFRKYTSDLFKLIREYLVQETLNAEPELRNYLYLAALEKQNPDKLIRGVERNWEDIARPNDGYSHTSYLYRHLLEERKYALLNYEHRPQERSNLEAIGSSLDVYFIVMKLRNALQSQTLIHHVDQQSYDLRLVPEIVRFLDETGTYLDRPVVAIYYYMFKMLTEDSTHDAYYRYKQLLFTETERLTQDRSFSLVQPALNYCRRRINVGERDFLREYLDVYRHALDHGLFDGEVLDPLQFRNTILIALRHGDYEWTEHYIEHYQDRLPERQRINAVNYNLATLYFYQKDYDQALDYLRDVEYENTTYNLNSKTMLLAIYYETDASMSLDSLFDSIGAYLNRHKELPYTAKEAFGNLVSLTRRLTRLLPGDRRAIEQLKKDLTDKQYVASRPWLEEKIAEFER